MFTYKLLYEVNFVISFSYFFNLKSYYSKPFPCHKLNMTLLIILEILEILIQVSET